MRLNQGPIITSHPCRRGPNIVNFKKEIRQTCELGADNEINFVKVYFRSYLLSIS